MTLLMLMSSILLVVSVSGWIYDSDVTNSIRDALPSNLTKFTIVSYSTLNIVIIYGGYNDTYYSDSTFILNLTNNQVHQINSNQKPPIRLNPCLFAANNSVFLFGGQSIPNNTYSVDNSFWMLNLKTEQWSVVMQNLQNFELCQMISESDNEIVIIGASYDGVLDIFTYSFNTSQLISRNISFQAYANVEVQQWDGTITTNIIDMDQAPSNVTSYIYTSTLPLPTEGVSILRIRNTDIPNHYIMQIDYNLYKVQFNSSSQIYEIKYLDQLTSINSGGNTKFVSSKGWNIFFTYEGSNNCYLTFDSLDQTNQQRIEQRIDPKTTNFYSLTWPNFQNSSGTFSLLLYEVASSNQPQIVVVVHKTLLFYTLAYNVFGNTSSTNYAINNTFYGINQCKKGWTGRNCSIQVCPGSLNLNGANKISAINFQCSGHGKCTENGCICDQLWEGPACNIYKRKNCSGTLLDNFPLKNCECFNTTIGSNSCDVIFCPSDCSNHGKCNQQGYCECNNNYYGADCSIMIIGIR